MKPPLTRAAFDRNEVKSATHAPSSNTDAVVTLTAPSTGPFAGFSVVADRADTTTSTFSGNSSWTSGAIYVKAFRFGLSGSATVKAPQLVLDTLKLSGAGVLTVG